MDCLRGGQSGGGEERREEGEKEEAMVEKSRRDDRREAWGLRLDARSVKACYMIQNWISVADYWTSWGAEVGMRVWGIKTLLFFFNIFY